MAPRGGGKACRYMSESSVIMLVKAQQWFCENQNSPISSSMPVKSDPAQWKDERHKRGLAGEMIAQRYLEEAGWRLLAHRFRLGRLEIDLILRKERTVAFVEVKTRCGSTFGSPLEAVTWAKQREIGRVASGWLDRFGSPQDEYRFDVVGVRLMAGGKAKIQHVEDAFRPGWR